MRCQHEYKLGHRCSNEATVKFRRAKFNPNSYRHYCDECFTFYRKKMREKLVVESIRDEIRCSKCKDWKAKTEFWKDSHRTSGYYGQCIACASKKRRPAQSLVKASEKCHPVVNVFLSRHV